MSWHGSPMDQRSELIHHLQSGEYSMAALCRYFGISRKTAYKWVRRHAELGVAGLADRSRRPLNPATSIDELMRDLVVQTRLAHKTWGGRKVRDALAKVQGHSGAQVRA